MLELQVNDTSAGKNSQLNIRDMEKAMNSLNNIMINCPTILRGMSHEMRTHMNVIVAFSYLMKKNYSNNSEREEFSNQIISSCEQLIGLFDSFFDSAIIDTGNSKTDSKICKLDNLLDDLLSEFREEIRKEDHTDVELVTEIQFYNSDEVFVDKNRIFRVIRSLFQNSIKNTKSGYIKIGYYFRDDKVTFYVLDSGQGYFKCKEFLHSEDLNESLTLYNDTYTAINITLAKKLIQMLGGTIWIECNGLTGAGIYFSVPSKMIASSDVNIKKYVNTMIAI
ncbi:MAG: HAMP domain-containing sensor histidine kinase [Bacteroidales bacterium]|nr:HAMP domain-containing sensor histidine kinase [Bacteroidales bacterium]